MNFTKTLLRGTAQKYNAALGWQKLQYGFERAILGFETRLPMELALKGLQKSEHIVIIDWSFCPDTPKFPGKILLMTRLDRDAYQQAQKLAQKLAQDKVEAWAQRYLAGDMRTKKLMARGAIQ